MEGGGRECIASNLLTTNLHECSALNLLTSTNYSLAHSLILYLHTCIPADLHTKPSTKTIPTPDPDPPHSPNLPSTLPLPPSVATSSLLPLGGMWPQGVSSGHFFASTLRGCGCVCVLRGVCAAHRCRCTREAHSARGAANQVRAPR